MIGKRELGSNSYPGWPATIGGGAAPALLFLAFLVAATATIAARATIVSIAPATAAAYATFGMPVNLRGL